MIDYIDVSKRYASDRGEVAAVDRLSLRVDSGELCVLLGPSGCGKTTLLRMTNRLIEPSDGRIVIDGVDTARRDPVELRRGIGYVIQGIGLFPHRTVAQNISTTLELTGAPRAAHAARVDELLGMMQLAPERYRERYPSELSGGEAQRVGVARALAADPPVLLMDEPFGALDPINRAEIQRMLLELQRSLRKTIVFVTHDITEAILLGDRIALMNRGAIVQQGAPADLVARPASPFVREFLGRDRNLLLLDSLTVADALEAPGSPSDPPTHLPTIERGARLLEALLMLLPMSDPRARVTEADGSALGTVSLDSVRRAMARLAAEPAEAAPPTEAGR